ncbi:MAG: 5-formyltetrahydrofolate cyclo-ligase [Acidobacteria bacterium]|nr:5-formyltetrahydrofolate cyclo-ligase [Acidobacteriota bacterium]
MEVNKAELRKIYLKKRGELSLAEVAAASKHIAERFFEEADLANVKKFHTFIRIAKFNEPDTSNIYYRVWREWPAIATYAPKSDLAANSIESIRFDGETEWSENKWGIREPIGKEVAEPEQFDLVLVPLLCFDRSGHRVGYGKGVYDQFLSNTRKDCIKIGISIFPPVEKIDDAGDNDVRLDATITPDEVFRWQ